MENKSSLYREVIESENRRINERLTTLLQFEGLLFTALTLGWEKSTSLIILLAVVGVVSSIALARALYNAEMAIYNLYKKYNLLPEIEKEPSTPIIGDYSLTHDKAIPRKLRIFLTPSLVLPISICIAWMAIFTIKVSYVEPIASQSHYQKAIHDKLDSNYKMSNITGEKPYYEQ